MPFIRWAFVIYGDQAGNRPTTLGDYDLHAVLLDFIEQFKAFDLEEASGY